MTAPDAPLRAISLWQPWAHAMAIDWKRIETRHWQTKHRGDLAIHAAKRWTPEERAHWKATRRTAPDDWPMEPVLGAIVAVVQLVSIERSEALSLVISPREMDWGNYAPQRFGWVTTNLRRLPRPVPTVGRQSLWSLPDDIAAQVRAQLQEARA